MPAVPLRSIVESSSVNDAFSDPDTPAPGPVTVRFLITTRLAPTILIVPSTVPLLPSRVTSSLVMMTSSLQGGPSMMMISRPPGVGFATASLIERLTQSTVTILSF